MHITTYRTLLTYLFEFNRRAFFSSNTRSNLKVTIKCASKKNDFSPLLNYSSSFSNMRYKSSISLWLSNLFTQFYCCGRNTAESWAWWNIVIHIIHFLLLQQGVWTCGGSHLRLKLNWKFMWRLYRRGKSIRKASIKFILWCLAAKCAPEALKIALIIISIGANKYNSNLRWV